MIKLLKSDHPALPGLFMMVAVASFSVIPALFHLGGANASPFMFTGVYIVGFGVGLGSTLLWFKRNMLRERGVMLGIWHYCKTWYTLVSVVGGSGYVLFAFGLARVDISIAAILYEVWPLFLILIMSRLFRDSARYKPISPDTYIYILMAILGVAFVITSQNDTPRTLSEFWNILTVPGTLFGVILVLVSAAGWAAQGASTMRMGELLAEAHSNEENKKEREVVFANFMACICSVAAGGLLIGVGVFASETISVHQVFYSILGGFVITPIGSFSFRYANLTTNDLGVNALAFATPFFALMWLWALSSLDVPHLDYLIIGAMGIVASNLLINVDASDRLAYKALIVSLWLFGTITYFYDGFTTDVPLELPVTIYILVLAFRVERLARRTSQEEVWVFDAFRSIRSMAAKENIPKGACTALIQASRALLDVDHHKSAAALKNAYERTLGHLENARMAGIPANEITEICRMIDKLAHSRQQGSRFGEIVAIALTGLLIVLGLLAFNGERGTYGEIASFVLSSVLVFLFFNIVDLQRDRKDETIVRENRGRYFVNFGRVDNRERAQYVSMTTSGVIVVVFVVLFFAKA